MEVSPPGAVVEGGSDAAAARVRERLSELDLARRAACEQRRSASAEAADPAQSVAAFAARAESCRRAVESTLATLAEPLAREGPHASAEDVRERVAAALLLVTALEQDVASSAYFLPKYDARAGSSLAASLRERLGAAEAAAAPRRKFSFAARKAPAAAPAPPAPALEHPAVPSLAACVPEAPLEEEQGPCLQKAEPGSFTLLTQQHLGGPHADFTVQDCTDCTVLILGSLRALRLRRLSRVRLLAVAVDGAVYAEFCTDCEFHVASAQVRVHDTYDTQLYLRVRSRPVIERSSRIALAPLAPPLQLSVVTAALDAAGLGAGADASWAESWRNCDDFGWHRAAHSPNWNVLEGLDRREPPEVPQGSMALNDAEDEEL